MMFHHLHHSIYRCDRPCLFVFELWNPPAGYPMPALAKLSDALFSNPIGAVEDGSLTALSSLAHPRFTRGRRGGDYENAEEDALWRTCMREVSTCRSSRRSAPKKQKRKGRFNYRGAVACRRLLGRILRTRRRRHARARPSPTARTPRVGARSALPSLRVMKRALVSAGGRRGRTVFRRGCRNRSLPWGCDFSSLAPLVARAATHRADVLFPSASAGLIACARCAGSSYGIEKKAGHELIHDGCFSLLLEARENKDIVYVERDSRMRSHSIVASPKSFRTQRMRKS